MALKVDQGLVAGIYQKMVNLKKTFQWTIRPGRKREGF
jgi:hypothetical protein